MARQISSTPMMANNGYEEAILALNSLQTNAATLQKVKKERMKNVHMNLALTTKYLERSGMTVDDLDTLKVIHVAGTKGKGSTCAFCESILRWNGLKTGFYSSPHLVSAVERIRLDGRPISRDLFTKYFWMVYDSVCRDRADDDRPPYFKFLTILAYNIFWREGVDVAVVEVGIGGTYDCTNIVRNPVVTGITALGLDHTSLLGNTITDIAWHKSGIMKRGVPTFIDGQQQEEALRVIEERGVELGSIVAKVPHLLDYDWTRFPVRLGLFGTVQRQNASLGLALSQYFLARLRGDMMPTSGPDQDGGNIPLMNPFAISAEAALALRLTYWPGRSHVVDRGSVVYFLDGAHTEESALACRSWFTLATKASQIPGKIFKVLLFNMTGDRDCHTLLQPFSSVGLDLVVFCTNMSSLTNTADQQNFTTTARSQLARCQDMLHTWVKIQAAGTNTMGRLVRPEVPAVVVPCINDALLWITQGRDQCLTSEYSVAPKYSIPNDLIDAAQVQVLVTGSLHLVGGVLACVEPCLKEPEVDRRLVASYLAESPKYRASSIPGMT